MATLIEQLKQALAIDKSMLDDEVIRQPVLFCEISEHLADANANRDSAKEELAVVDAELNAFYREKHRGSASRITDTFIASCIQTDPIHHDAFMAWLTAKKDADKLLALKEAFQQRSYMLRDLVSLYSANYYEQASLKPTAAQEASHYANNRVRMANARAVKGGA